ncbi:AH receptor-interacting protein [Hyalella azteca]|uniref:AH receptor-interacting protein n=1 Tax=Hyalella azteca TaxID=294128 RepID=A0A8B7NYP9_HYAAZ|nr:AH receptor-interacting protein [Hyalella azteca]
MSGLGIRRFIKCLTTVSGTGDASYPDGTKLLFHLKTEALPEDTDVSHVAVSNIPQLYGDVIDDSRHWKQPVELILGKQFKLEVLEECVKNMKLGEVTEFLIDKKMLSTYPIVSQTMRKALSKNPPSHDKEGGHRCCGMGIKEGLGHADLDGLIARPRHMKFTVELLKVELPGSYEKQFWEMTDDERRESVSLLRQQGNELFNNKRPVEAGLKYKEAIARLDNLMLR